MSTLTLKDVSEKLKVSTRTARRYVKSGIIPMRKMNGETSPLKISEKRFEKWRDGYWDGETYRNEIF